MNSFLLGFDLCQNYLKETPQHKQTPTFGGEERRQSSTTEARLNRFGTKNHSMHSAWSLLEAVNGAGEVAGKDWVERVLRRKQIFEKLVVSTCCGPNTLSFSKVNVYVHTRPFSHAGMAVAWGKGVVSGCRFCCPHGGGRPQFVARRNDLAKAVAATHRVQCVQPRHGPSQR